MLSPRSSAPSPSPARTSAKIDRNRSSAFLGRSPSDWKNGNDWCDLSSGCVTSVRGSDGDDGMTVMNLLRGPLR